MDVRFLKSDALPSIKEVKDAVKKVQPDVGTIVVHLGTNERVSWY